MTALGTLGRYRLIRRLAAGGMGEVYLAELPGVANFSQRVAIKRILPHLARDTGFVEKFIDEAYIMMRLHHGNIVGVHELADESGELYIVMEYLPGRDLKAVTRRLREQRAVMPVDLALWLVSEICAALDYAHRKTGDDGAPMHIVHRDVSPSNVLLGAAGEVKLLDFGIARARGRLHQSVSGTLQGKFVYMSPEQADGRTVDARSDIYSAGLVLYELVTGVRPFEGDSETETLRKVRSGVVAPPSAARSELPDALDTIVMRALQTDPGERYPTAAAMLRAMQLHLADTRSHAGAQQLSEWLAELFPEGVEAKDGPAGPMSIEDALEMQLGALTPNIDPMTRTHTADAGTPSAPAMVRSTGGTPTPTPLPSAAINTGPQPPLLSNPSMPAAAIQVTDPSMQQIAVVPAKGRKRAFALAVLLGALTASVVLLWWLNRSVATIDPIVTDARSNVALGAKTWSVRQGPDGPELLTGVELEVKPIDLCIVADGYETACKSVALAEGRNQPRFRLKAVPEVVLSLVPGDIPVLFTIDGKTVEKGKHVIPAQAVQICVTDDPPNWQLEGDQPRCVTIVGEAGKSTQIERSFVKIPDAAAQAAPVDAGAPPSAPDASPQTRTRVRPKVRIAKHTITVEPAGAVLRCGATKHVQFPARIELTRDQQCVATAKGFATERFTLSGRQGGKRTVALKAFGRLSVRALPGAARLLVNGKPMKDSVLKQHPVPAGAVQVEARYTEDGKPYTQRKTVTVAPGKTASATICVQTPKFKCPGGA